MQGAITNRLRAMHAWNIECTRTEDVNKKMRLKRNTEIYWIIRNNDITCASTQTWRITRDVLKVRVWERERERGRERERISIIIYTTSQLSASFPEKFPLLIACKGQLIHTHGEYHSQNDAECSITWAIILMLIQQLEILIIRAPYYLHL